MKTQHLTTKQQKWIGLRKEERTTEQRHTKFYWHENSLFKYPFATLFTPSKQCYCINFLSRKFAFDAFFLRVINWRQVKVLSRNMNQVELACIRSGEFSNSENVSGSLVISDNAHNIPLKATSEVVVLVLCQVLFKPFWNRLRRASLHK